MTTEETRSRVEEIPRASSTNQLVMWEPRYDLCARAVAFFSLNNSVQALAQEGPQQEIFVTHLQKKMEEDVMPMIEETAGQT